MGSRRFEGRVECVRRDPIAGDVTALVLSDGHEIEDDISSIVRAAWGLLIQQTLRTGSKTGTTGCPAIGRSRFRPNGPNAARSTRAPSPIRPAGKWRIQQQHRNGNGLVFRSSHYTDEKAADLLQGRRDLKALDAPGIKPFRIGRALRQWNRNVIAEGLPSGFLEPLESTSIYLIQSTTVRLLQRFPHEEAVDHLRDTYNCQSQFD